MKTGITLTKRESDVCDLIVTGLRNKEIASALCISHRTVETHRRRILTKAGARNAIELVRMTMDQEKTS